jgi:prepilin-type processing-associated H-X9-DG protein
VVGNVVLLIGLSCLGLFFPAVFKVHEAANRLKSANNLKRIGIGMLNYHDSYQSFPPQAITSPDGKPLLSWRVALLPHVDEEGLYRQFHLNEPWDSPHNKSLLERMPVVYRAPNQALGATETHYQVFVGRKTDRIHPVFIEGGQRARMADIVDGSSMTLLVVEAATPVPWTKPDDLPYAPEQPVPQLGGITSYGANGLFADGSVRTIPKGIREQVLRDLITCNDGNVIPPGEIP